MRLDLEGVGWYGSDGADGFDVVALVVRQADGTCVARSEGILEGWPRQGDVSAVEGGQRPVYEEEVDVVGAQIFE